MGVAVSESDLLARINEADSLPTPPVVLTQINKVVSDPNTSAQDVAAVVSEDPAMTAKILRLVNSAFYAMPDTIASVKQAIFILGINAVQSLVQCAGVFGAFAASEKNRAFQDQFWRHSLITASAARVLCIKRRESGGRSVGGVACPEEAFTAGVLHDIGKMVLVCQVPDEAERVWSHPDFGKITDSKVELEVLGLDHTKVGGVLARRWKLPAHMIDAIEHHHDLDTRDAEGISLARIAHVADYLAYVADRKPHQEACLPRIVWHHAAAFGLDEGDVPNFTEAVREEYGRAQIFLQMMNG